MKKTLFANLILLVSLGSLAEKITWHERAKALTMKLDRLGVYELTRRINDAIKKPLAPEFQSMNYFLETFYTEQGQNKYSGALAIIKQNPKQGIARLREANEAEPLNQKIIHAWAVAEMYSGQCPKAIKRLKAHLIQNPIDKEGHFLLATSFICVRQPVAAGNTIMHVEKMYGPWNEERVLYLKLMVAMSLKDLAEINFLERKIAQRKQKAKWPAEPSYLKWETARFRSKSDINAGEKYIQTCRRWREKSYLSEPFYPLYCRQLALVEKEIAVLKERSAVQE